MLGKKSRPVIGILTGSFISGNRATVADISGSPRSHTPSPKGPKTFDFGGVGLGIVAALETSGDIRNETPTTLFTRNLSRSDPVPIASPRKTPFRDDEMEERDSLEEYTIVTRHVPNKSYSKVYGNGRSPFRKQNKTASVFHISPVRYLGETSIIPAGFDFLNTCHLCQKKLQGEDIYMYRGEKAFCSTECRYKQIVMDEQCKDKCSSEAVDLLSRSPYANEQIFTAGGILAI